ncbi:MAG: glycosyltransferase, partial [Myxococcota bacterium]|nr:glycosyltransferase [Myxococcota bacterium]
MSENLICIPTYNERENIRQIIPAVLAAASVEILIIDDNSPDGTGDIVRELAEHEPAGALGRGGAGS